ncbi:MAG: phosphatase PAP2 family protein [Spirochaetes bacterium]|nr:phosphatase PAP2 family protein [Spirochaetota bacterium]
MRILKDTTVVKKKNILPLTAFLGIGTALFVWDSDILKGVQEHRSPGIDNVLGYSKYFGEGWFILGLGGLNILSGELFFNRRYTLLGIYIIEGFVISGLFVSTVKFIIGRERPYVNNDPYHFKPFNFKTANKSFYSGHTTEAFTLASIIAHFFKNRWVSAMVYSIASLTAIERVYNDKHWPSDVFIGGVAGVLIGKKIIEFNSNFDELSVDEDSIRISFITTQF